MRPMVEKSRNMLYPELSPLILEEPSEAKPGNKSSIMTEKSAENLSFILSNVSSINLPNTDPDDPKKPLEDSLYPSLQEEPDDLPTCPCPHSYKGFLEKYILKVEVLIDKFEDIRKRAETHHYRSNCAKVSGTVVSTTGVALVMGSLIWAPVTAGSSLVLGAGGAVMSVTGSLTSIVTDYIDYKTTKVIMDDIKILLEEKEVFDKWLKKSLSNFNECIDRMVENGISKEVAISTMVEGIAKGIINIIQKPEEQVLTSIVKLVRMYHIEHVALETLPVLGKTFHMSEKGFQFIYNILGLTGKTIPTVMKEFAKISGVLSIAFALADISLLIKDLCSDHPSVELIERVIAKLQDEKRVLCELVDILKEVESNKEGIFDKAMQDIRRMNNQLKDKDCDDFEDYVIVDYEELLEKTGTVI